MGDKVANVDDYLNSFPDDVRLILLKVRATILAAVPAAEETIKYQMPTITLQGRSLVHFAAWKHHIGLYPLPRTDGDLQQELAPYRTEKGIGRFPLQEPMPYDLIERLVLLLADQNQKLDR